MAPAVAGRRRGSERGSCLSSPAATIARAITFPAIWVEFSAAPTVITPGAALGRGRTREGNYERHPDADRSGRRDRAAALGRAYGPERHPACLRPNLRRFLARALGDRF